MLGHYYPIHTRIESYTLSVYSTYDEYIRCIFFLAYTYEYSICTCTNTAFVVVIYRTSSWRMSSVHELIYVYTTNISVMNKKILLYCSFTKKYHYFLYVLLGTWLYTYRLIHVYSHNDLLTHIVCLTILSSLFLSQMLV